MTIRQYNDRRAFEVSYFSENDVLVFDKDVLVATQSGLYDPYSMVYINQIKLRDERLRRFSNITGEQVLTALREEAFLLGMQRGCLFDSLFLCVSALYRSRFPEAQDKVRSFYQRNGFDILTTTDSRFGDHQFEYGISPLPKQWDRCWGNMSESITRLENLITPLDHLTASVQ
jgi:hypothetical protein